MGGDPSHIMVYLFVFFQVGVLLLLVTLLAYIQKLIRERDLLLQAKDVVFNFVYDIGDLYKADVVFPAAFQVAATGEPHVETHMRHLLRDRFFETQLLDKIVPDIASLMRGEKIAEEQETDFDADDAVPSGLWDPGEGLVPGGVNHSEGKD